MAAMLQCQLTPCPDGSTGAVPATCFWLQLPAGADCALLRMPGDLQQAAMQGHTAMSSAWCQLPLATAQPFPAHAHVHAQPVHAVPAVPSGLPPSPQPEEDPRVEGRVWILSQDSSGSRRVQQALEEAVDDKARAALV